MKGGQKTESAGDLPTSELVRRLVQSLVDKPGAVSVREIRAGEYLILELDVDPRDRGLVIGREGRMLKALRIVASRWASLRMERVRFEFRTP